MILDDVLQVNDKYIFLTGDRRVNVNYADLLEIYQKAGTRCTEYNNLRAALKCVDDKFIEDMKKYIDAKCKYSEQWNKTHDVRYHWKAEDAERQALENKCKSVGAFTVLEKITELSDKYYKLKMQAYRVMQGRGWL